VEYREGLMVGYRHHTTAGIAPLFPFGHGLGYSTFELGEPTAPRQVRAGRNVAVTIPVRNSGSRDGSTVVQVYVHDRTGRVFRPRRELGGFAKVRLAAGASADVTVDLPGRSFAFYDRDSDDWVIPQGAYTLEVGLSSEQIVHSIPLKINGGFTGHKEQEEPISYADRDFVRRLGRPIPTPRPMRPYVRNTTLGEVSGNPVGQLLRAAVLRFGGISGEDDPTTRKMIERSLDEMPLRGLALMSGGRISLGVIDGIVELVNKRPDRTVLRSARGLLGLLPGR